MFVRKQLMFLMLREAVREVYECQMHTESAWIDYFDLAAMPSRNSPAGSLMRRILDESPDLTFEQAKQLTQPQLLKAAAKRNYRVTTPRQDEETAKRFKRRV